MDYALPEELTQFRDSLRCCYDYVTASRLET